MKHWKKNMIAFACAFSAIAPLAVPASARTMVWTGNKNPGSAVQQIIEQIQRLCPDGSGGVVILPNGGNQNWDCIIKPPSCDVPTPPAPPAPDVPDIPDIPDIPDVPDVPDEKPVPPDTDTPDQEDSVIQRYAKEVADLVNQERAAAGLAPLSVDLSVQSAAQVRAKEQTVSFSHTRPNGSSCFTALTEAGVSYRTAGENIAWGQKTPQQVMQVWMNSSSHKANILGANFTKIGVGCYIDGSGAVYWTQMFIS